MNNCTLKHIKFQPKDDEWKCPKCGCGSDDGENGKPGFYVDDSENFNCDLIHELDYLRCGQCGYDASGKQYYKDMMTKLNMVTCPHCKGTGLIKKGNSTGGKENGET